MRVCAFIPSIDLTALDRTAIVRKLGHAIESGEIEEVYFTSHRGPKWGVSAENLYLLPGHERLRMTIGRRMLRVIDICPWVPTFLARIPLRLMRKEILETLLAMDPDVIVCSDLRWGRQLARLIQKAYPQWTCLVRPNQALQLSQRWRKFDPSSRVSIILPTYNGSRYIRQSIESCLKQTFRNIELIIVDDGSSDETARIVSGYDDTRLRYLRHDNNRGLAEALNTGFTNSTGEYLTWTSDDNYYTENALEEMVRFAQTYADVDFVYAENYVIDHNDRNGTPAIRRNEVPEWLKVDNGIGGCFLYKREVYEAVGEFNPRMFLAEDYDYWIRVWKAFRMQRLFKRLYYYRFHKNSLTGKHKPEEVWQKVKLVKEMNDISY